MADATIVEITAPYTLPPTIIIRYQDPVGVAAGAAYTELLGLPIFSVDPSRVAISDSTDITWKAYSILFKSVHISCSSDKFTAKILVKDDISLIDSIDEVYAIIDINTSDARTLLEYIVKNNDDPMVNKLYFYLENNGAIDSGPIDIELTYVPQIVRPS